MWNYFGYLDPGTGSLFIQAIFGVGLALLVVLRKSAHKTVDKLKLAFSRQKVADEES